MACSFVVRQGDQYPIGLTVKDNRGEPMTPENTLGLRVKVGEYELAYPGKIEYKDEMWVLPLTQKMTYSLTPETKLTVQAKMPNGDIYSTGNIPFPVEDSQFKGVW